MELKNGLVSICFIVLKEGDERNMAKEVKKEEKKPVAAPVVVTPVASVKKDSRFKNNEGQ